MSIKPLLRKDFTNLSLSATSDLNALEQIAEVGLMGGLIKESWLPAVLEREGNSPTGLPTVIPIAIPHTDAEHCLQDGVGFFRLLTPVSFGEMGSLDRRIEVQAIIPLLITEPKAQLPLLMSVINLLQDAKKCQALMQIRSTAEATEFFSNSLME